MACVLSCFHRDRNVVAISTLASYFVLYSGFDKASRSFKIGPKLADIFLVRKSWAFTIDEINKVLGLAGLTLLGGEMLQTVVCPPSNASRRFLWPAAILAAHGTYSGLKYQNKWFGKKAPAMLLGASALAALLLPFAPNPSVRAFATDSKVWLPLVGAVSVAHFVWMELDTKGNLAIRPYGFLALVVGVVATGVAIVRPAMK